MNTFEPMGEGAWRIPLPEGSDLVATLDALRATPGVTDAVVTETHALVCFDPRSPPARLPALDAVRRDPREVVTHVVGVCYDGPDLVDVAARTGLTTDAVIALHTKGAYEVLHLGFLPGFAYLGPLDPILVLPRRAEPRARVAALSVAIAGARTGVYPFASPGGWHLLGRAVDFVPFDPERGARWRAGDRVRFEAR